MPKWLRIGLAFFIPPLAVVDMGLEKLAITTGLWIFTGGPGGILAAFFFIFAGEFARPAQGSQTEHVDKRKNDDGDREYIRLADGDVLEVVDTRQEERIRRLQR